MRSILILFIVIFVACDSPVRTRSPYAPSINTSGDEEISSFSEDEKPDDDQVVPSSSQVNTQEGFENCNLGLSNYALKIGNFGLCQSQKDEIKFKTKLASSDTSIGTCFVPIHVNADGSSYFLGPAQCVNQEANKTYDMTLSKDRSENINGVMVVKANALNGYMQCMTAKMQFMNSYNGCQYDQYCLSSANQYAQDVCYNFTQVYDGHYYQLNL